MTKECSEGKELNLKTNRCRKVCKENEIRNLKGRCIKNKNPERGLVVRKISEKPQERALVVRKISEKPQERALVVRKISEKPQERALVVRKISEKPQERALVVRKISEKQNINEFNLPFDQFKDYIKHNFSKFKQLEQPLKNECAETKKNDKSSKLILRPHQEFVSEYFKPSLPIKGVLLYYSIGSGKSAIGVNVASQFEKEGYSILWVTRRTLMKDIEKNLFEKSAHSIINEAVDKKIIKNTIEAKKRFFSSKLNWFGIVSYKTFSNLCKGNKTELYQTLVNKNGKEDIFKKTLIIIDEIHKLFDIEGLSKAEMPQTGYIQKAIQKSYDVSGKDSLKLLLMSGTPVAKGFDIINLLKDKNKVNKDDPEDIVKEKLKGLVFYFDMSSNPNFFAQKKYNDVDIEISSVPIELSKKQDFVKENCVSKKELENKKGEKIGKEEYKVIKEECKKIKSEIKDIKRIPYQENILDKKCGIDLNSL